MKKNSIILRQATKKDVNFVAPLILETMDFFSFLFLSKNKKNQLSMLATLFLKEENIFSYAYTKVFENDGDPLGIVCAYLNEDAQKLNDQFERELETIYGSRRYKELIQRYPSYLSLVESEPGDYYIQSLAVAPSKRKKGLGTILLERCEHEAKSIKAKQLGLLVEKENVAAIHLYKKFGFQIKFKQTINAKEIFKCTKNFT